MSWHDKPTRPEPRCIENGAKVYDIGAYRVTVHPDQSVEYRRVGEISNRDPRRTLPNMAIEDGELRVPVSDLAGEILARMKPRELAESLLEDDDARNALIEALARRYMPGMDDESRRSFLSQVKEAVHSQALDDLARAMSVMEHGVSRRFFYSNAIHDINAWLRKRGIMDDAGEIVQLRLNEEDEDRRIGGTHWNEAREYWRAEVKKHFPGPIAKQESPA